MIRLTSTKSLYPKKKVVEDVFFVNSFVALDLKNSTELCQGHSLWPLSLYLCDDLSAGSDLVVYGQRLRSWRTGKQWRCLCEELAMRQRPLDHHRHFSRKLGDKLFGGGSEFSKTQNQSWGSQFKNLLHNDW